APDREGDLGLDFTGTEQSDPVLGTPEHPCLHQCLRIHRRIRIERAGIDRRLNFAEIDLVELASECLVPESALGQATVQRHLAAFEALDACAGAGGLSFAAAAAGFSGTGADTAADAGTVFPRPRTVGDFVQLHRRAPLSSTTRTKCLTLAIMPRTCGVSGTW